MHQPAAAQVEPLPQLVHRQIGGQIAVDIAQDLVDLGIGTGVGLPHFRALAQHPSVELHHDLQKERLGQHLGPKLPAALALLQCVQQLQQPGPVVLIPGEQIGVLLPAARKAPLQPPPLQRVGLDPENDPGIRRLAPDDRLMDGVGGNEQQIAPGGGIAPPLHPVGQVSGEEQNELVKFVVVVGNGRIGAVFQMKEPERLLQIAPFVCLIGIDGHGRASFHVR